MLYDFETVRSNIIKSKYYRKHTLLHQVIFLFACFVLFKDLRIWFLGRLSIPVFFPEVLYRMEP